MSSALPLPVPSTLPSQRGPAFPHRDISICLTLCIMMAVCGVVQFLKTPAEEQVAVSLAESQLLGGGLVREHEQVSLFSFLEPFDGD